MNIFNRLLRQVFHNEEVIRRLSETNVMMKAAEITHDLKLKATENAMKTMDKLDQKVIPKAIKIQDSITQSTNKLIEDAKHDWNLLQNKLNKKQ